MRKGRVVINRRRFLNSGGRIWRRRVWPAGFCPAAGRQGRGYAYSYSRIRLKTGSGMARTANIMGRQMGLT